MKQNDFQICNLCKKKQPPTITTITHSQANKDLYKMIFLFETFNKFETNYFKRMEQRETYYIYGVPI